MTAVFLSAGIPDRDSPVPAADPLLIRESVLALVSVVTPNHDLVFGGHPAISPLVEHAANSIGTIDRVHIFQSRYFQTRIPAVAYDFKNFYWTPKAPTRDASLLTMRETMMGSRRFRAGVFIGGMQGVIEECTLFKRFHRQVPVFPVASTGGAALQLFSSDEGPVNSADRVALQTSIRYRAMFRRLLQ